MSKMGPGALELVSARAASGILRLADQIEPRIVRVPLEFGVFETTMMKSQHFIVIKKSNYNL